MNETFLFWAAALLASLFVGGSKGGLPKPRKPDIARGVFWGSIAGFTSFVSHAGGAALQAYTLPQQMPKMMFAGTATILFATINMMKVPPYLALGLIEFDNLRTLLALGPVAILGTWIGYRLTKLIPEKTFFVIVEIALFLVSVNLIRLGLTG